MTSQGTDQGQFARAVERRNVATALAIAYDRGQIGIFAALQLVLLVAEEEPHRYPRYAARWHARYVLRDRPDLARSQLVLAALLAIPSPAGYRALAEALAGDKLLVEAVSPYL